ncbi:MAG: aminotransferase class IV [Simkaniaceae bacterium]
MLFHYIDGQILPESETKVLVSDLSVMRGYGVFDYCRIRNGRPFHIESHIKRFRASAKGVHLPFHWTDSEILEIIESLIEKNGNKEICFRLFLLGGESSNDFILPSNGPRLSVLSEMPHPYPMRYYREGMDLMTFEERRFLPSIKTTNYLPAILALKEVKHAGGDEALFVSSKKELLEATTSNFFAVIDRKLITPPLDGRILPGITRDIVLKLALTEKIAVEERAIDFCEIPNMTEAFLTSTNKDLISCRSIDGIKMNGGEKAEITRLLRERFHQHIELFTAAFL